MVILCQCSAIGLGGKVSRYPSLLTPPFSLLTCSAIGVGDKVPRYSEWVWTKTPRNR